MEQQATIVIGGIPPWDGSYPIDLGYFTNRELHTIKQIAGVRAGEFSDAMAAGDNDLLVALTVVAAQRNGKEIPADRLWDAAVGAVTIVVPEQQEDDDAGPPEQSGRGSPAVPSDGSEASGSGSSAAGGSLPENGQKATGSPGSATTAASVPATSVT